MTMRQDVPIGITHERLVIVEGYDEFRFLTSLCCHCGVDGIQILPIGGKTLLKDSLGALKLSSGFADVTGLGIVRDADEDAAAAFSSVRGALQSIGFPAPTKPLEACGDAPWVMVIILPGDNQSGALEDLCLRAVADRPAMACIDQYIDCLRQCDVSPVPLCKAKAQAYLAAQPQPGKRLGEAAEAGYWPWDSPAFDNIKSFLRKMCA